MNFIHWIVIMKRGFAGATNTRIVFALFQLWIIIMINLSETFTENTCIVVRNINNYRYFRPSSRGGTTKWTMTELHRVCNDFNENYLVCAFAHHIYGLVFRVWIFHMWHFIWLRLFFRHIITHNLSLFAHHQPAPQLLSVVQNDSKMQFIWIKTHSHFTATLHNSSSLYASFVQWFRYCFCLLSQQSLHENVRLSQISSETA